jgi:hypothetical protein
VSKPEAKPITDAMQKGEEPLRSFGDLLQFFDKTTSSKPEAKAAKEPAENPATDADSASSSRAAEGTAPTDDVPETGGSEQRNPPGVEQQPSQSSAAGDASGGPTESAEQAPSAGATPDAGSDEPPSPADKSES